MKFIWIFGPPAVGKMTVGQELEKITGLKLFHNHMVMDLVAEFADGLRKGEGGRLMKLFIEEILTAVAESDMAGLIYTSVSRFDNTASWDYSMKLANIFESRGAEIYFVELEADFEVRIERNKTPNRLAHKPSKRDVARSEQGVRHAFDHERNNSREGEVTRENYLRIDNSKVNPDDVAKQIKDRFSL